MNVAVKTAPSTVRETIIAQAMEFPMEEVLLRYAKDAHLPIDAVREHERELKRYLALCAINPAARYGMRGPIDQLWHAFLMFTRRYSEFCQVVAGQFLHHEPTSAEDRRGGESRQRYQRFLEAYQREFGEEPPAYLWPRPARGLAGGASDDCYTPGCGCSGDTCRPS